MGGQFSANRRRAPHPEPDFAESGRSSVHLPPASLFGDYSSYGTLFLLSKHDL
jgi:hypothetical protein